MITVATTKPIVARIASRNLSDSPVELDVRGASGRRLARRSLGASVVLVAALLAVPSVASAEPDPPPRPVLGSRQAAITQPDSALGSGWRTSSDILVTGAGDTTGFHVYVAREKDAFAWSTIATLNAGLHDVGAWTGYVCVTGSGRRAAVVYAPAIAVNKPGLITAGAFAAIVDTITGRTTMLNERVQLAYFNPSCGPTERVLFTRSVDVDQQRTDLIAANATTARTVGTRRIKAQLTNPVPARDGDYGVVNGDLVKVGKTGGLTRIGRPGGQPYAVKATAGGAIDVLTVQQVSGTVKDPYERAAAYRYNGKKRTRIGDAPRTRLELFGLSGGRDVLVGDVSRVSKNRFADLSTVYTDQTARAVSRQGHLVALEISPPSPGRREPASRTRGASTSVGPDSMAVTVQATRTGTVSKGEIQTERKPAADVRLATSGTGSKSPTLKISSSAATSGPSKKAGTSAAADLPVSPGTPTCAVPRNDITIQVPQPSENQVEWAVDLAVQGTLKVQRPANYLKAGNPAYTPQGMFPKPSSPRVPAQVMLAILAQETNMAQASWHVVPGDAGNPLVSDYYGTRASGSLEVIDYADADCGYGISQVTDGMRVGSGVSTAKQEAIATDYAANIAAGLRILVEKWNQLQDAGVTINNSDPRYIENWYLAAWGYNSGVYPNTGGNYGVGFLNNPANPTYPANRQPFLRGSLDDASHPADWPYQEKIMGWAETPQWAWRGDGTQFVKYLAPAFGSGSRLSLPLEKGRFTFCSPSVNNCNPNQPSDPCPAWNSTCWWHGHATWLTGDAAKQFATERLRYTSGTAEPEVIRTFPRSCTPVRGGDEPFAVVVDDLADSTMNVLGCPGERWGGKFTLRGGYPSGSTYAEFAQVDLHQGGFGHMGHAWFTYTYNFTPNTSSSYNARYHQVVGSWTPDIVFPTKYRIMAHLPRGSAAQVEYVIWGPAGNELGTCQLDQGITHSTEPWQDVWVNLGAWRLEPGSRVQVSNLPTNGVAGLNVGYDAMAFVPFEGSPVCGSLY